MGFSRQTPNEDHVNEWVYEKAHLTEVPTVHGNWNVYLLFALVKPEIQKRYFQNERMLVLSLHSEGDCNVSS